MIIDRQQKYLVFPEERSNSGETQDRRGWGMESWRNGAQKRPVRSKDTIWVWSCGWHSPHVFWKSWGWSIWEHFPSLCSCLLHSCILLLTFLSIDPFNKYFQVSIMCMVHKNEEHKGIQGTVLKLEGVTMKTSEIGQNKCKNCKI